MCSTKKSLLLLLQKPPLLLLRQVARGEAADWRRWSGVEVVDLEGIFVWRGRDQEVAGEEEDVDEKEYDEEEACADRWIQADAAKARLFFS